MEIQKACDSFRVLLEEQLRRIEEQLDQCWDLLRQRRARLDAGENPDDATVRPVGEVEGYKQ